jgi:hypothetical protein
MKLLASAASVAIVAVAVVPYGAMAGDSAQFSVTVTGHVSSNCNWASGGGDVDMTMNNFVDRDSRVRERAQWLRLGVMGCNQPAYVSLKTENGGMKNKDDATCTSSGTSHCVNYIASADWNDATVTYTTDGTPEATASSGVSSTNRRNRVRLTVTPQKPVGDVPLVAGDFTDTLTVQVGAPL